MSSAFGVESGGVESGQPWVITQFSWYGGSREGADTDEG